MLTDKNLSRDMDEAYICARQSVVSIHQTIPHRVMVLTTGTWPELSSTRPPRTVLMPPPQIQVFHSSPADAFSFFLSKSQSQHHGTMHCRKASNPQQPYASNPQQPYAATDPMYTAGMHEAL